MLELRRKTARVCLVVGFSRISTDEFYSVASPILTDDTLESLQSYATSLLATLPDAKGKSRDDSADVSTDGPSARNGKCKVNEAWKIERDGESADEGGLTGCREAVELLTRNQRKGES